MSQPLAAGILCRPAGTVTFNGGLSGLNNIYQAVTDRSGFGTGWELMGTWDTGAPGPPQNISFSAVATQSSAGFAPAARAVDGNTDGHSASNSVAHANLDAETWWELDLGQTYSIDDIVGWNRIDCCADRLRNFHVFVSDVAFTSQGVAATQGQAGVGDFAFPATAGSTETFGVNRTGRYVRVQLTGTNYLQLGEVQVFTP